MTVTAAPSRFPGLIAALRVLVGVLLLGLILNRIDLRGIAALPIRTIVTGVLVAGVLLILAQALSTVRWRIILGPNAPGWTYLFRLYLISSFASLFLPTSIGGDAFRIAALSRRVAPGTAASSVVFDRIFGMLALGLYLLLGVGAAGWAWVAVRESLSWRVPGMAGLVAVLGLALLGGLGGWLLRRRLSSLRRLWGDSGSVARRLGGARGALLAVFGMSFAVQGTYIFTWIVLGHLMGISLTLGTYLVAVPVVSLAAMLPVTISGLGVREGAWLVLLAGSGTPAATVVAFSLLYFLGNLVLGAVGGVAFVLKGADSHGTDVSSS